MEAAEHVIWRRKLVVDAQDSTCLCVLGPPGGSILALSYPPDLQQLLHLSVGMQKSNNGVVISCCRISSMPEAVCPCCKQLVQLARRLAKHRAHEILQSWRCCKAREDCRRLVGFQRVVVTKAKSRGGVMHSHAILGGAKSYRRSK